MTHTTFVWGLYFQLPLYTEGRNQNHVCLAPQSVLSSQAGAWHIGSWQYVSIELINGSVWGWTHLLGMHNALGLIPSTTTTKRKKWGMGPFDG
jgi:hypothetical protein